MMDHKAYHGEIKIGEFDDLIKVIRFLMSKQEFIFRGQSNAKWQITSSLERAKLSQGNNSLEDWILIEFKQNIRCYSDLEVDSANNLDCLMAIQHYGGPTRLVDFTASFPIALFFALDGMSNGGNSCVHVLNPVQINQPKYDRRSEDFLNTAVLNKPHEAGVLVCYPRHRHSRLAAQQGLFVVPLDRQKSFMENLTEACMLGPAALTSDVTRQAIDIENLHHSGLISLPYVKILISSSVQQEAWEFLLSVNLTHRTMFPGFEGFCRSLILQRWELWNTIRRVIDTDGAQSSSSV